MIIPMNKNISSLLLLSCLLLFSHSPVLAADQLFYTIQTGSFKNIEEAAKQYDDLVPLVNEEEIERLRIEKIGKYYTVRLGKYNKVNSAEKSLSVIKKKLRSSIIMEGYYKEDRIKKLNDVPRSAVKNAQVTIDPVEGTLTASIQPEVTKKIVQEKAVDTTEELTADNETDKDNDALKAMEAKLALQPDDPELNGRYGTMLFRMKKPVEAIPYLKKAAELSPEQPEYRISMGYCFLLLSRYAEALDEFNTAVNISPLHVGALTGLGISYSELGEKDKAMGVYEQLKPLDSVLTEILLQIIVES